MKKESTRTIKYIVGIVVPLVVLYLFFHFVAGICRIPSGSMETTIFTNDIVFVNRLAYKSRKVNCGDVVVLKKDKEQLIKRVIGTSGDKIVIENGCVYRNNSAVSEPYALGKTNNNGMNEYNVPKNSIFLLGDNREKSKDSRFWENPYVSNKNIVGRAYFSFGFKNGFHFRFL